MNIEKKIDHKKKIRTFLSYFFQTVTRNKQFSGDLLSHLGEEEGRISVGWISAYILRLPVIAGPNSWASPEPHHRTSYHHHR